MNAPRLKISQDTMRLQCPSSGKMAVAPSCHVGTRCRTSHRASSGMGVADGMLAWYRGWGWGCGVESLLLHAFWCAVEVGGVVVMGSCAFHVMEFEVQNVGCSCRGRHARVGTWGLEQRDWRGRGSGGRLEPSASEGASTLLLLEDKKLSGSTFFPHQSHFRDVALLVFPFPGIARRERPRNATSTKPGRPPPLGGALSAMASWCPPWRMRPDATYLFDGTSPGSAYLVPRRGQRRQACIIDHLDLSSLPGVR